MRKSDHTKPKTPRPVSITKRERRIIEEIRVIMSRERAIKSLGYALQHEYTGAGNPDPKILSRKNDPVTSKMSAIDIVESGALSDMMQRAMTLVDNNPGRTAKELERIGGYTDGQIRKRLSDLRRNDVAHTGEKRRCQITKKVVQTWWPGKAAANNDNQTDHQNELFG